MRHICAQLPGASERPSHGGLRFFVGNKSFAFFADNHHNDGRVAAWLSAPPGMQRELIASAPGVYFKPPYVGVRGWVGIELNRIGDEDLAFHIHTAWELVAPKKLLSRVGGSKGLPADHGLLTTGT